MLLSSVMVIHGVGPLGGSGDHGVDVVALSCCDPLRALRALAPRVNRPCGSECHGIASNIRVQLRSAAEQVHAR